MPIHRRGSDLPPDELNGDSPIWLRAVYRLGIPAAICLFLLWFVTQAVAKDVHQLVQDHRDQQYYLRAICLNVALTDAARSLCQPPPAERAR